MNTRTENINCYTYCAYCGKELRNLNYAVYPNQPILCNCEKAKEELELYEKLKELYNTPLAESLIEKKVKIYRNKLLGINEPVYYPDNLATITCVDGLSTKINTISVDGVANDTVIGRDDSLVGY